MAWGGLAQLGERQTEDLKVAGMIPAAPTFLNVLASMETIYTNQSPDSYMNTFVVKGSMQPFVSRW